MLTFHLVGGTRVQPYHPVPYLDGKRSYVIGEGIEGATAGQIEFGMVPVAGKDAVVHGAAMQGEPHVRAAVVQGVNLALVEKDSHRSALARNNFYADPFQFLRRAHLDPNARFQIGGHGGLLLYPVKNYNPDRISC